MFVAFQLACTITLASQVGQAGNLREGRKKLIASGWMTLQVKEKICRKSKWTPRRESCHQGRRAHRCNRKLALFS